MDRENNLKTVNVSLKCNKRVQVVAGCDNQLEKSVSYLLQYVYSVVVYLKFKLNSVGR